MADRDPTEFSRPFVIAELGDGETQLTIEADLPECEHLARRFDLVSIASLKADLALKLNPAGEINVSGRLDAEVVQTCVVSLEPVPATLAEVFSVRYAAEAREPTEDLSFGPNDEEPAEPLTGDIIDLGELVAQQVALALDPFPRKPGVRLDLGGDREGVALEDSTGPFAPLADLKRRNRDGG